MRYYKKNCRQNVITFSMEKRNYYQWSKESMEKAIESYQKRICGFNECCRRYGIPKPTFQRHLQNKLKMPLSVMKNGTLQTLPEHVEKELAQHILNLEESFFGLNITDVR